jgi:hypothetical protein
MAFMISRLRAVSADDAAFPDLVAALPDGPYRCLCCRRPIGQRSPDSLATILVADQSDDDPRALCAPVCSMCSTTHPIDQLLADWAERLVERYGGSDIPDQRFGRA